MAGHKGSLMRLLLSVLTAQIATSIVIPIHLFTINDRFYFFIQTLASVCRIMLHFTLQLNFGIYLACLSSINQFWTICIAT